MTGRQDYNFLFLVEDEVTLFKTCSVNWRNRVYMFGGKSNYIRQIATVSGIQVIRTGTLSFDHEHGACGIAGNKIYLCFSEGESKGTVCRRASGPTEDFEQAPFTSHVHYWIQLAASPG